METELKTSEKNTTVKNFDNWHPGLRLSLMGGLVLLAQSIILATIGVFSFVFPIFGEFSTVLGGVTELNIWRGAFMSLLLAFIAGAPGFGLWIALWVINPKSSSVKN